MCGQSPHMHAWALPKHEEGKVPSSKWGRSPPRSQGICPLVSGALPHLHAKQSLAYKCMFPRGLLPLEGPLAPLEAYGLLGTYTWPIWQVLAKPTLGPLASGALGPTKASCKRGPGPLEFCLLLDYFLLRNNINSTIMIPIYNN